MVIFVYFWLVLDIFLPMVDLDIILFVAIYLWGCSRGTAVAIATSTGLTRLLQLLTTTTTTGTVTLAN